jgi:hypothetical protein
MDRLIKNQGTLEQCDQSSKIDPMLLDVSLPLLGIPLKYQHR